MEDIGKFVCKIFFQCKSNMHPLKTPDLGQESPKRKMIFSANGDNSHLVVCTVDNRASCYLMFFSQWPN